MTRNLKMSLFSILCIAVCGLLVGYKNFESTARAKQVSTQTLNQEVSAWVAESVEQKLSQLEASVSYLDKSTVESLRRFGSQYFAYVYKKQDGEWGVKWKVLYPEYGQNHILKEVNSLNFDELPEDRRVWQESASQGGFQYVAPVKLAESHQLKSGFLVFGLKPEFFDFINRSGTQVSLVSRKLKPLFGDSALPAEAQSALFDQEELQLGSFTTEESGVSQVMTSYFSPVAQLWVLSQRPVLVTSFLESSHFLFSLLGALLVALLFLAVRNSLQRQDLDDDELAEEDVLPRISLSRPRFDFAKLRAKMKRENAYGQGGSNQEIVSDFSIYLDSLLEEEQGRLEKVGVSVQTHVEEGAQLLCSPKDVSQLLKRLIGNSVLALSDSDTKDVQIRLVEENSCFQLIYLDTRQDYFPGAGSVSIEESSKKDSTTEAPVRPAKDAGTIAKNLDDIIAHAAWLFGDDLTVAKEGFCLSVDLPKVTTEKEFTGETLPFVESLERIEIKESSHDDELAAQFSEIPARDALEAISPEVLRVEDNMEELGQEHDLDELMQGFELKDLSFEAEEPTSTESVDLDEKGHFELNTGEFKLKIRPPKKKDTDVDR